LFIAGESRSVVHETINFGLVYRDGIFLDLDDEPVWEDDHADMSGIEKQSLCVLQTYKMVIAVSLDLENEDSNATVFRRLPNKGLSRCAAVYDT
jgi:hypothetical protein